MRQKYNITREQVDYLLSNVGDKDLIESKLKSWFPLITEKKLGEDNEGILIPPPLPFTLVHTPINEDNELKRNTWYRNTEGVGGFIFHKTGGYAFGTTNISDTWWDNCGWGLSRGDERALYVEATTEEIRSFLIRIAKSRGYIKGNYTSLNGESGGDFNENFDFAFLDSGRGGLLYTMGPCNGGDLIFRDGVWATINIQQI